MDLITFFKRQFRLVQTRMRLNKYWKGLPSKVKKMRTKEKISVLFVLSDLSLWKTECLYKAMLSHDRFEPILGTCLITADVASESIRKYENLIEYLKHKGYKYTEIYQQNIKEIDADIVFYQQPYNGFIARDLSYEAAIARGSLICYCCYGFNTLGAKFDFNWMHDLPMHRYSWQCYFENVLTARCGVASMARGKNVVITGVPIQDLLSVDKTMVVDPWKPMLSRPKRIIYAPHHTIPTSANLLEYSTFLDEAELMLELAEKYNGRVQFAFKPHPFLKKKLYDSWGEEKTNAYYNKWAVMPNTQLEEGDYLGLFMHSDAMIHDCSSFIVEYCYTKNPMLFLTSPSRVRERREELNEFAQMAFDLHRKGISKEEIESFVLQIIAGEDTLKGRRTDYYNNYLLPPHQKSASENIINAILGEGEYVQITN